MSKASKKNRAQSSVATVAAPVAETPAVETPAPATVISAIVGDPIRSRTNRQTGTRINSYRPSQAGASWPVKCKAHETVRHYTSRKAGKLTVYTPASWCEGCAAILAEKQAAAKEKAAKSIAPAAEEVATA